MPVLFDLIPHRNEDPANNPLAASVTIVDEHARRFYAAINGHRSVRELSTLLHLERNRLVAVVQMLLIQNRIQLREAGGHVVKSLPPLDDHGKFTY